MPPEGHLRGAGPPTSCDAAVGLTASLGSVVSGRLVIASNVLASDEAAPAGRDVRGRLVIVSDVPASDEAAPAESDGRGRQVTAVVVPASVVAAPSGRDGRGLLLPLVIASDVIGPAGCPLPIVIASAQQVLCLALGCERFVVRIVLVGNNATK